MNKKIYSRIIFIIIILIIKYTEVKSNFFYYILNFYLLSIKILRRVIQIIFSISIILLYIIFNRLFNIMID